MRIVSVSVRHAGTVFGNTMEMEHNSALFG